MRCLRRSDASTLGGVRRTSPSWSQGVLSAACIVVTLAGSTVAEAYQIFLKASAITTLLPFCYMFLGLATLDGVRPWQRAAGVVGLIVSAIGALAAFVPTEDVENVAIFELKLVTGALGPMAVGLWLYLRSRRLAGTASPGAVVGVQSAGD